MKILKTEINTEKTKIITDASDDYHASSVPHLADGVGALKA